MIGPVRGLVIRQDRENVARNSSRLWNFELELSPHVEERMIDRRFSEVDLRLMFEMTNAIRRGVAKGRWILETAHDGDAWEVVVEPDEHDQVIVVITAYRVTQ